VARQKRAFYGNRGRSRSRRGRHLQRLRAEYPERGFALLKRTGGLARVFVRGRRQITKKVQSYVAAANLSVILRALLGMGTPRVLQSRLREALAAILALCRLVIA
jgi:transposase